MTNLRRVCVAPMIDCTDRYFRQFIRQISKHAYLYTEMLTAHALLNASPQRFLAFDQIEHPVALQVGGCDPIDLAKVALMAQDYGYDEVNLNVGCPSPRVQAGRFGACLMKEAELVARCVEAMQAKVEIPITVKTRIGVDEQDSYPFFYNFVETVAQAGCKTFIVHARKAWLNGLSPKQNRTIPQLKYDYVHQLKQELSHLEIIINGGITDLDKAQNFKDLDGIMVGREAYGNPFHLIEVDSLYYQAQGFNRTRKEVLQAYAPYAEQALNDGLPPSILLKHLYGLSHGIAGGSRWRRDCAELLKASDNFNFMDYQKIIELFPDE